MISNENQKLIDALQTPVKYHELISEIVDNCRLYGKEKGYSPLSWKPVPNNKYFCAYKQGASGRGEGAAIIGFENRGEGLCLIFHHVVFDSKGLSVQTPSDLENRWRRVKLERPFSEDEEKYLCKLAFQCFDRVFD